MTHLAGFERDQLLLLPDAVDDYVDADNPVRFIDASLKQAALYAADSVTRRGTQKAYASADESQEFLRNLGWRDRVDVTPHCNHLAKLLSLSLRRR
jgi:hypothetical protein